MLRSYARRPGRGRGLGTGGPGRRSYSAAVTVWAIVVAAGRGTRFGGPKDRVDLAGRPVLHWSIAAARSVAEGIVLVVPPADLAADRACPPVEVVVAGGDTRAASVRAGLGAVPSDASIVVVHDAARPAASPALFRAVVAAVRAGADAAVPGLPLVDTVKRVDADGAVVATVDRESLVVVQTPQAFAAGWLRRGHAGGGDATDDAALVERAGGRVVIVAGEPGNRKLTTPEDLDLLAGAVRPQPEGGRA